MSRCTVLQLHTQHYDPTKKAPTFVKQFQANEGFVIERLSDGAFRVTHEKAAYVLGIGASEVLEWREALPLPEPEFMPLKKAKVA